MALKTESVPNVKDVKLNILAYGKMGTGKTHLMGTGLFCSELIPMLIVDIDKGLATLSGSDGRVVRPRTFNEIQEIYNFLRFENTKYKSVAFDSITETQKELSMDEIVGQLDAEGSYQNLAAVTPATQYNWLSSADQMRRFIRAFRDLAYLKERARRIHVIFLALERYDEKANAICPALPGVLGMEIGASVDILARTDIEEKENADGKITERYVLTIKRFRNDDGQLVLGKVREPLGHEGEFPRKFVNPSMTRILDSWKKLGVKE